MAFEIEGKLYKKFDTKQVTDTFKKREFVIEVNGPYPQYVQFQLTQDKCDLLDSYNEQQEIKVSFDVRGREWKSPQGELKYFNSLNAWKLDKKEEEAPTFNDEVPSGGDAPFPAANDEAQSFEDNDDLPF